MESFEQTMEQIIEQTIESLVVMEREAGYPLFILGSGIRDRFFRRPIRRLRILTKEDAKEMATTFARLTKAEVFGREDGDYEVVGSDKVTVLFMKQTEESLTKQLGKRIFTIDAIAMKIQDFKKFSKDKILDPYGGLVDIERAMLRMVDPVNLLENPVEFLRGIRLMAENDLDIDRRTEEWMKENVAVLRDLSGRELCREWFRILDQCESSYYINLMERHIGMLHHLFPEIQAMKEVGECKYHVVDAFTHSIYTLRTIENVINSQQFFEDHLREAFQDHMGEILDSGISRQSLLKMGALFHDIGKPAAQKKGKDGSISFRGHDVMGSEILRELGKRLGLSPKVIDILSGYALLHMNPLEIYKTNDLSGERLYEMFRKTGQQTLDILLLAYGDIVATRTLLDPGEEMGNFKVLIEYMANNYLLRYLKEEN